MNSDFKDLLRIFEAEGVEYLIVGAYAVMHYTQPRYTKDLDIWLKPSPENAKRIAKAFLIFGVPMVGVTQADFEKEGLQYLIGMPPSQIDFLTSLPCPLTSKKHGRTAKAGQAAASPFTSSGKQN